MAYNFTSASSQFLSTPTAVVAGAPVTMACRYNRRSTTTMSLMSIGNTTTININSLVIGAAPNNYLTALTNNGTTLGTQVMSGGDVLNVWNHACAVFYSASLRRVFLNGVNSGDGTTEVFLTAQNVTTVGGRYGASGVVGQFWDGLIAEAGIWDVALTQPEIASLARGMTCDKIRPQNLVFYAPLIRDLQDTKGGLIITPNNGPIVAPHPRVYR